jgi:flagellin-like hook-associated protein FlgL
MSTSSIRPIAERRFVSIDDILSDAKFSRDISSMETNLRSAIGRIEDVDIAAESANLAKYSILTQASAAMVAQANSSNDIALMLLR